MSNQQTVKYVKMFDSHKIYEVKSIDHNFEGDGTAYMLEVEKGMIEPYSERLIEEKFYSYAEMHAYLYGKETEEVSPDDNILRIPVEPVPLPCSECGSENYPNYRYELVGLSGILCKPCLNKELATINAVLSNEQEDRGYDEDFLEAIKPENWSQVDMLHTPTMDVKLEDGQLEMTLPDCQVILGREETEALARFLVEHMKPELS